MQNGLKSWISKNRVAFSAWAVSGIFVVAAIGQPGLIDGLFRHDTPPAETPIANAPLKTIDSEQRSALLALIKAIPNVAKDADRLRDEAQSAIADERYDDADKKLQRAEELYGQAVAWLSTNAPLRRQAAAQATMAQGKLAMARGNYKVAGQHFTRAADLYPAENFRDAIQALNDAGNAYNTAKALVPAEYMYDSALSLATNKLDEADPLAIAVLTDLADLYHDNFRYAKAEVLLQRLAKIQDRSQDKSLEAVATLVKLAKLYRATNRASQIEPLLTNAIKITEDTYGSSSVHLTESLVFLANLYAETGRKSEAGALVTRALKINEHAEGIVPNLSASMLKNIGVHDLKSGHYETAEAIFKYLIKLDGTAFGPDHPKIAAHFNTLGRIYVTTDRNAEAEAMFARAVKIFIRHLGPRHVYTKGATKNLAAARARLANKN